MMNDVIVAILANDVYHFHMRFYYYFLFFHATRLPLDALLKTLIQCFFSTKINLFLNLYIAYELFGIEIQNLLRLIE